VQLAWPHCTFVLGNVHVARVVPSHDPPQVVVAPVQGSLGLRGAPPTA
jgi:hypothetical protein